MQMKNRKERGEAGKIHHIRNAIGRENLITCEQTNELALRSGMKALIWPTEWD